MTAVRCPVNEAAQISRDEPALVLNDRKISYSEFEFYVTGAGERLRRAGCHAGDPVACLLAGDSTDAERMALAECWHFIGGASPARQNGSGVPMKYREVSVNAAGEILVRGQALFAGYIEKPGLRRPVDKDGWFATGEQGRLEGDGYLTVLERKKQAGPEAD